MESIETSLPISSRVSIPFAEIELSAIRASGPGGQHVNKVSTAIHLRFDICASSLPEFYKERLLAFRDQRISKEGVVVIKAQQHRSVELNRADALERLRGLILRATAQQKARRPTKPTRASKERRMDGKRRRAEIKSLRGRPVD